ncbi:MAG: tRNA (N(6)-L-threonylcarbamoyladenosine(37)-C(2))-methylthiotransferase MtaB [Candidatus Ratteibacteria bacterium]|nr:tRNA (N(6)-L-threonylcarbamoyladenosine(37)-C(2))-methylthiotransferase MtaB [Candidatus Ratteibacteria bacterium]
MSLCVASYTLGCKVNQYETEAILEEFFRDGFRLVPFKEKADVYLVNTCTVTAKGERESKYAVRQAKRFNPRAKIIVTGCLVQTQRDELAGLPGVVLVAGNPEKEKILTLFKKALDSGKTQISVSDSPDRLTWDNLKIEKFHRHTRAFIKIQDGCDAGCHYCIVPRVRGKMISRPLPAVKEEIRRLINYGFKEIVLTGIRLGKYGGDLNPGTTLAEVLEEVENEPELLRIRLSSLEPGEFTPGLIRQIAGSRKICPHFHIPLQSGDNEILSRMGRNYTGEEYLSLIGEIKRLIPEASFSTDIMVGFPGEKEGHFLNTVDFLKNVGFNQLHIFTFSPRKLTLAANFPGQVPLSMKKNRSRRLHQLAEELKRNYRETQKDRTLEVLVEKKDKSGNLTGLTGNYVRLSFFGEASLINQLVKVRIGEFTRAARVEN